MYIECEVSDLSCRSLSDFRPIMCVQVNEPGEIFDFGNLRLEVDIPEIVEEVDEGSGSGTDGSGGIDGSDGDNGAGEDNTGTGIVSVVDIVEIDVTLPGLLNLFQEGSTEFTSFASAMDSAMATLAGIHPGSKTPPFLSLQPGCLLA